MIGQSPRLRVIALEMRGGVIRKVARADVVGDPLGCWHVEAVMTGIYDPSRPRPRPFVGERLSSAVWDPMPPDALVPASADAAFAIPGELTPGVPWIVVSKAWARLMPYAPSWLLEAIRRQAVGWEHRGDDCIEDDIHLTIGVLRVLLDRFPAEELAAFSR